MTIRMSVKVVAAVIQQDGRYLVGQRPSEKRHAGLWEFPGGKVHEGEPAAEAVRRELSEELDVCVTAVGRTLFSHADPGSSFLIMFVETEIQGTPVALEHKEICWCTPEELRQLPLAPTDAVFVHQCFASL